MIAEISFSTEEVVIIGTLLATVTGATSYIFKLLIDNYASRLAEKESQLQNWKQIASEAVVNLHKVAKEKRASEGMPPYVPLVPVVPEHNSPATMRELETAELQTVRASLVAATKDLGLEPRSWPIPEGGEQK
jgi:hypothetical protein